MAVRYLSVYESPTAKSFRGRAFFVVCEEVEGKPRVDIEIKKQAEFLNGAGTDAAAASNVVASDDGPTNANKVATSGSPSC